MKFLPAVVHAEHRGGFRVHVVFNDASENTIDFGPWLEGPMFEPLKDHSTSNAFSLMVGPWCGPTGRTSLPRRCMKLRAGDGDLTSACSRRRRVDKRLRNDANARAFAADAAYVSRAGTRRGTGR